MFYVYVLYSQKSNRYYVGLTTNIKRRLNEHNNGKNASTKAFLPWKVIYNESFDTRLEARRREKYLKTAAGRKWRKANIRPRGATE
ncbi:GIY-YIG nuclease family protein [Flagellimonas nanhaiensis]|uniref:GIY-YIG nuclease family protein n=1 Tax=Flagellimonas nanhaiensis TaxID=2292706 RepID=A0A371JSV4_9FLAO|nr:GIY-YIG nuclease family protein [Allomuricauda nanhaiensis]RDY60892.1 GIY-YIG nuclease family protein [Allomuricauda nanhaiensis]